MSSQRSTVGLGMQAPPLAPQTPLNGCMTGQPSVPPARRRSSAGVHLRVVEAENAAEGALQLVAHHLQQVGVGGAEAVEQDDAVGDGGVGVDVVQPDKDAVVLAAVGWLAPVPKMASMTEPSASKMTPSGIAGGRGRHVGGRSDLAVDEFDLRCSAPLTSSFSGPLSVSVTPAVGTALHKRRRRIHHGHGLLVGDRAVERALVDVVVDLAAGPVHRLAQDSGVEVADSGNIFWPAGEQRWARGRGGRRGEPSGVCGEDGVIGPGAALRAAGVVKSTESPRRPQFPRGSGRTREI